MEEYGPVERSCCITNAAGECKGYALVEFKLPSTAAKAKTELDKIKVW
jgi:hypothetical protein